MLQNKIKKHLTQLQQKKFRKEFQEFIIEGVKGVSEALNSKFEVILVVVDGSKRDEKDFAQIIELAEKKEIPVEFCGRDDVVSIKTTDTFPGVLAVVEQREVVLEDITDGSIICLDQVKDPGNLGTIIRTADWFGVKNILLSEDCVDLHNPKVVRGTMGSIFHVNVFRASDVVGSLGKLKSEFGFKVISMCMDGENINRDKIEISRDRTVFVFGSESHGVREEIEKMSDKKYTILGKGQAESLNVAISVGVLLSKVR